MKPSQNRGNGIVEALLVVAVTLLVFRFLDATGAEVIMGTVAVLALFVGVARVRRARRRRLSSQHAVSGSSPKIGLAKRR
jgi:hypothetical protein